MSRVANRIAALNDAMRRAGPDRQTGGNLWLATDGVTFEGADFKAKAFEAVRLFDAFNLRNNRRGERDFGRLVVDGKRLVWKIDYYDIAYSAASLDPADPARTHRVLTVMLASEY